MSKTLGILAGLGPLAGAHFYRRCIELTPACSDAEHLSVVLISERSIPSRLDHLANRGPSPAKALGAVAQRLVGAGAEVLAIPSTTTHAYYSEIVASVTIPVLNLVDLVALEIARHGSLRAGIVATSPTRDYGLYDQAFAEYGIQAVYPDPKTQQEITTIINGVKSSGSNDSWGRRLVQTMGEAWAQDADSLVLACTETPVVFPRDSLNLQTGDRQVFDATDILARAAIAACQLE